MRLAKISGLAGALGLMMSLNASSGIESSLTSTANLYNQIGGAETVSKLAGSLLGSAKKDSHISGLLGGLDTTAATPKVENQLCATLGGGCDAPFTDEQIDAAAGKLTPTQKTAVSDALKSSLKSVAGNSMVRDAVTKAVGPRLGGVLALLE